MRWNVEGVDGQNKPRLIQVDAETAEAARSQAQQRGLRVSEVLPSTVQEQATPAPPVQTKSLGDALGYAKPAAHIYAPNYGGLTLGGAVLLVLAVVSYVGALLWGYVAIASPNMTETYDAVLAGFVSIVTGALLQTLSAASHALRDIARNSFR